MYTIGVTGGVGSGKSTVVSYLEEAYGAYVLRMDDVGRALLEPDGACYDGALELFGQEVLREDGTLDRSKIAAKIFQDETLRMALDGLIHPAVRLEVQRQMEKEEQAGTALFVLESALMLEEKYNAICNELWYIYADTATRYSRVASSRGYSAERFEGTVAKQQTEESFRAASDLVIDNSGSEEETRAAVDRRMQVLREKRNARPL